MSNPKLTDEERDRRSRAMMLAAFMRHQMIRDARASVALDLDSKVHTCHFGHCEPQE